MENEIWKDIPCYEGFYQASNYGNIKRLQTIVNQRQGKSVKKERIMRQCRCRGYLHFKVSKYNLCKTFLSHRIIALTFIPNPENKPCVNHVNGIKTDNRVENLEWCTYSENELHSYKTLGKIHPSQFKNKIK